MKLQLQFENYKKLRDLKADFDGNNIYLVQGGNERGKTTFINGLLTLLTAKNKTLQPVSIGQENGKIVLDAEKDGQKFKIVFEFTNDKNKFTLVTDSKIITKIKDIREFFDYTDLSADEFISWSNTAEGRRKQRDIVLKLLPGDIQRQFVEACESEAFFYNKRKEINAEIDKYESHLEALRDNFHAENKEFVDKVDIYRDKSKLTEERITKFSQLTNNAEALKTILTAIQSNYTLLKEKDFFLNNAVLTENIKQMANVSVKWINDFSDKLDQISATQETSLAELHEENNGYIKLIHVAESYLIQKEEVDEVSNKIDLLVKTAAQEEKNIADIRKLKLKLISEANFPIKEIDIEEDGLYIHTHEGRFPFDTKQISTSLAMLITSKILLLLNKHLPVIVVGRAESFDRNSLNNLHQFAIDNKCVMVLDRVIESDSDIEIVGYENKGE